MTLQNRWRIAAHKKGTGANIAPDNMSENPVRFSTILNYINKQDYARIRMGEFCKKTKSVAYG